MMSDSVAGAVAELEAQFPGLVTAEPDGEGGAFMVVEGQSLGEIHEQDSTWIGFHITFQYPYADVYPHYARGDLRRADGAALGAGTSATTWRGRVAVQLSRRSNLRDPATETAVIKLHKVIDWLRSG